MSTKDKKVKSSKGDDKKQPKKTDEVTIVVDRSNVESAVSPGGKTEQENAVELDAPGLNDTLNGMVTDANQELECQTKAEEEKPLSDATKLTEILVERLVQFEHLVLATSSNYCSVSSDY